MSNVKQYVIDLRKTKTLAEISAQTSVSRERLETYTKSDTINAKAKNFNRIFTLWIREVYCHAH